MNYKPSTINHEPQSMNHTTTIFPDNHQNTLLLERFKAGDEKAFACLYRQLYARLLRVGERLVKEPFEVHTIVQEAFLKCWQMRAKMESLQHAYRFMRLNITWSCMAYYRNSSNSFRRRLIYVSTLPQEPAAPEEANNAFLCDEERLRLIYNVLPYLQPDAQTITQLYFKHGMSCKIIAKRFGSSSRQVQSQLQQSLGQLKQVIHAQKKLQSAPTQKVTIKGSAQQMDAEMETIFKLRYEQKMGFDSIAAKMNVSRAYILQQYAAAHQRIQLKA